MGKNRIQKVTQPILRLPQVNSIGVIGDPGCEGLGTYNMKVYAGALEKSGENDITLIAGDLVPIGNKHYYEEISGLTEVIAHNDIYVLRGNHDTGAYEDYFGRKNYALLL
ncbi:MAG: metallophosphoesterase, partial [Lachnospiraceae bacterium]|nr:metallophosphoesterase [Lachnospiraceae bacterium]